MQKSTKWCEKEISVDVGKTKTSIIHGWNLPCDFNKVLVPKCIKIVMNYLLTPVS